MSETSELSRIKLTIESKGDVVLQLDTTEAPNTCAHISSLVRDGFYNGVKFHRVIPGFVAQAGDPNTKTKGINAPGIGSGGSGKNVKFEPNSLKHEEGALGMARSAMKDSGDSQFYICLGPQHGLDGEYIVFGKVLEGMDVVNTIVQGDSIEKAEIV